MKVCVVVVYLGSLPVWMPTYLKTCYKSSLDFKIFTNDMSYKSKGNVEFIQYSREGLLKDSSSLGFNLESITNRKICELKVFYGTMFKEYLLKYDYWGIGDLDVFYGAGAKYINEESFKGCDLFSTRARFMTGHGSFYRNAPEVNSLFFDIPKVKEIMMDKEYKGLDEFVLTKYLNKRKDLKVIRKDIIAADGRYDRHHPFSYVWDNGKLYNKATKKEYFYVHFMNTKNRPNANWKIGEGEKIHIDKKGVHNL